MSANHDPSDARNECRRLMCRYAEALDGGDMQTLRELFEHAELRSEGQEEVWRGGNGAVTMLSAFTIFYDAQEMPIDVTQQPGTPRTMHVLTNMDVAVDAAGQGATARSCYTVFQSLSDFPLQPIVQGRYRDRFECVDGRWRFSERFYIVSLQGDLSRHLKQSI